jgi:hypothetical protein
LLTVVAVGAAIVLSSPSASAANTAWTKVGSCNMHTIAGASVTVISGSTKVTADDGGASGSVGLSVKTASTTSSATFAATSVTVTGKGMTEYKAWH